MSVATGAARLGSFPKVFLSRVAFWFCACNVFAVAVFSQGAQNNWTITGPTVAPGTYQAYNSITAGSGNGTTTTVNSGSAVTFQAGTSITLLPNFHAAAGSAFHALISTSAGTVATPTFSPPAGTYTSAQSVTLGTATGGATIRYTTNGSTPSETVGTVYSGPVAVGSSMTIKAIAYESGWLDSAVPSATYTITGTVAASLTIASAHTGTFTQGQSNATYTLMVANGASAGATNGAVAVTETAPSGLIPVGMQGAGWTCAGPTCVRSDALAPGSSYPAITLTVDVANHAPASVTNSATVAGGGSANANASDPTAIDAIPRYSNPLAFAVPASVVAGAPTTFTVTYASQAGSGDIASGQVQIDTCYLEWDSSGNITLHGAPNHADASGTLGQNATIWGGSCSINLASSSLSPVTGNPDEMALSLAITFPEENFLMYTDFFGMHEVYAWGTNAEWLETARVDLGAIMVSQGPDFTLNVTPGGGNTITLGSNGTATLTLTTTGLNGFNGSISILRYDSGASACFTVMGMPSSMPANAQRTITIAYFQTQACPAGVSAQFTFAGEANGGLPNELDRYGSSTPVFVGGAGGDFTITVGSPSAPWLSATGSVSYPVTVQSVNGAAGNVNLGVSGVPAGVGGQLDNPTVYLNSWGTAGTTLRFTGSGSMPGGTYPLVLTGTLQGAQRTAAFSLGTQVTTFQVTSVTGSAIADNSGQEVQATLTVPAGNAPSYTRCGTAHPAVTCRVISASADTVRLGITAGTSVAAGNVVLNFNDVAAAVNATIQDFVELDALSVSISQPVIQPVTWPGWTDVAVTATDPARPGYLCVEYNYCEVYVKVVDQSGRLASWAPDLYFYEDFAGNTITVPLQPGPGDAGNYELKVEWCFPEAVNFINVQLACVSGFATLTVLAPPPPPTLSCTPTTNGIPTVTRGGTLTCTVSDTAVANISSWQFTGGGATVNGPAGTLTWSGTMVVGGTVAVFLNSGPSLQQGVTVNPRSWHTQPASPTQVDNGQLTVNGQTVTLPVPPAPSGDDAGLGKSGWGAPYQRSNAITISGGPNAGFTYYASPLNFTSFFFQYIINPDLLNQNSVFSQHQCGSNGFILWSDLLAQTRRHEYNSQTESHWVFYANSMNQNNPGDYVEGRFAIPGFDLVRFGTDTGQGVVDRFDQITADAAQEPYPINYNEAGTPLGNINYGPDYARCQ